MYALGTHTYTYINGEVMNEGGLETKSLDLSYFLLSIFCISFTFLGTCDFPKFQLRYWAVCYPVSCTFPRMRIM